MEERPPDFGHFSAVDRADAAALGGYLDAVRGEDAVRRWKALSFELAGAVPGATIVDVGCGHGDDVRELGELTAPGGRAVGVDASEAMIAEARRRVAAAGTAAVELHVADATHLPLADGVADGCRCERVLLHVDDPDSAIAEMARVTRPGGVVVAAEPDWGTLVVDGGDLEVEAAVQVGAIAGVRNPGIGRSLRRRFAGAGLQEVDVIARTLVIAELPRALMLLGLDAALERAVAAGLVAGGRASAWRAGLDEAAAAGRLTAAITSFMTSGRVPELRGGRA